MKRKNHKVCHECGASLDFGEKCDCENDPCPLPEMEDRRVKRRALNYEALYAQYLGIDREEHRK